MVQSTVANSILGAIQGIASAPGKLAQTRSQEMQNQILKRELDLTAEKDLVSAVEGYGNYRLKPTDPNGSLYEFDMARLYKERPDLVLRTFNADKEFNIATDENGRKFQTEITRFINNEDGSISAVVRRTDGKEAPLTENRTAQGDDIVVKISPEDFNKAGSRILGSMMARGAGDNAATFVRSGGELTSHYLRNVLTNTAVSSPMADDPAAMSGFYMLINTASDEALKQIATDLNIDVPAVQAEAEAFEAKVREETPESPQQTQQQAPPTEPTGATTGWSIESVDKDTRSGRLIAQIEGGGRRSRGQPASSETKQDAIDRLDSYKLELEQRIANVERARASAGGQLDIPPERDRLLKDKAELEQINSYLNRDTAPTETTPTQMTQQQPVVTKADLESNVEPPPAPIFDREGLIETIRQRTSEPTQEQYEVMARYLQSKNVQSAQDLSKLPTRDAHMAVWLAASNQPGSVTDRLAVAQQMLDYIQTGSLSTTPSQAAAAQARAGELDLRRERWKNELKDAYNEEVGKAVDDLVGLQSLLAQPNGELFLDETNTAGATTAVNSIWNKYTRSAPQSAQREAYARIAMEALLTHMLAKSNSSSPGLFEVAKRLDDWRNSDGQLRIGKDAIAGLVRETQDGFEFVDPSGGNLNFTIRKGAIKRMYGDDVYSEVQALARGNAARTGGE